MDRRVWNVECGVWVWRAWSVGKKGMQRRRAGLAAGSLEEGEEKEEKEQGEKRRRRAQRYAGRRPGTQQEERSGKGTPVRELVVSGRT